MSRLAALLCCALLASGWPRVAHLANGSTVSVWRSGRVVIRDRHNEILSDSYCGSYARYVTWEGFMSGLQHALKQNDRTAVADRILFPLSWSNHGTTTVIRNRAAFLERYTSIFRPAVVGAVIAADPRALFCKNLSQAALDSGVVWGDISLGGRRGIITVNPPLP
jgi:hypothetical protein